MREKDYDLYYETLRLAKGSGPEEIQRSRKDWASPMAPCNFSTESVKAKAVREQRKIDV